MATQKKAQVVITCDAKTALKVTELLDKRIEAIKREMKDLDNNTKEGKKQFAALNKELQALNGYEKENIKNTERINHVMKNLANTSLRDLKRALSAAKSELNKMSASDPKLGQMRNNIKTLQDQIDKVTGSVRKQSGAWQTAIKNMVAYTVEFAVFGKMREMLTGIINLNFKYSDSLADIRKVSNLSMKSVEELSANLAKIDSRTSLEGLTQYAYMGSRLGIATKYGVQGLVDFAASADRVAVALHEDLGDDAMLILSKFVETMGDVQKHGNNVSAAFDAVSSSIFKLASTSTANGGNIIEFAKRMTGLAKVTHVASDELLALASASDTMMLMPEVSSTAFNKFITSLWTNYRGIEDMLGMQKDSLKQYMENGQTMQAVVEVLKNISGENLNSLDGMFKEFGSDGARLKQVIVTMAQNVGVLEEHLRTSNQAYREGSAVMQEYKIQQQTAQAILERANNMWEKAFVNPEGIDAVKEMAKMWYDFSKALTQSQPFLMSVKVLMWELQLAVKALISVLPSLLAFFGTKGIVTAIGKLPTLFMMLSGYLSKFVTMGIGLLTRFAVTIRAVSIAWQGMNLAMRANFLGAIATTVTIVATGLWKLYGALNQTTQSYTKLSNSVGEANKQYLIEQRALANSANAILRANKGTKERLAAINNFNKAYGPYLSKMLTEANAATNIAKAYREAAAAIREKTYAEMRQKDYDKNVKPRLEREVTAQNKLNEFAQTTKNSRLRFANGDWAVGIAQDSNKNTTAFNRALKRLREAGANITDDQASYIWGRRSSNLTDQGHANAIHVGNQRLGYHWDTLTDDMRQLHMIAQVVERNFATRHFDAEQNRIWGDKGLVNSEQTTETLTLTDPTVNTKTGSTTTTQIKEWRQQLKEAQDQANAIIDKIKNYYERQILEVTEKANSLNLDEAQTEALTRPIRAKMNDALAVARKAISNVEQGWDTFKQTMQDDMIEVMGENGLNESQMLLDQIEKADLKALQEKIATLSKSLNRPESALMDQIWRNATKNAQANANAERKQREEIQKILLEHNYTGIVDNNTTQQMEKIGAFALDVEQVKILLGGDKAKSQKLLDDRVTEIATLLKNAREHIVELYTTDVTTEEGRNSLMAMLFGDNWDQETSQLKAVFDLWGDDIQAFYLELLKYIDEYDAAQKRKDDERKKLNDYMWSRSGTQKFDQAAVDLSTEQKKESSRQYSFGAKNDAIYPWGQTEATDPELALLQLKMKLAKDYYDYIESHGATDEQLIEAGKNVQEAYSSIMDAIVTKAKATAEAQMKWYKPIEQYGTALGEAMMDESKTVKDATRDMINSFIDLTGEYVNQKLTQWIMTKLYNAFIAESEEELATTKQAVAATNATTSVTEASVEVAAGTAAASAKTLGQLGWWGIPLIAVIGGVLGGLMALAKGALSKAFGSKTPDAGKTNTKLVSGMLTYDSGNVQDLKPFFDKDGNMYWATESDTKHSGVSLLTSPTATTINGRPSLVAENGPELVIGRETTRAMMQNNPALLKALYAYDKHHSGRTAYDRGNLAEFGAQTATADGVTTPTSAVTIQRDPEMVALMSALLARLNEPINAKIDMYGRGNLYDSMSRAQAFMKNK